MSELLSFPDAASLGRGKGRGVVAGSPGSTTAPTNPQRASIPLGRAPWALASVVPPALASVRNFLTFIGMAPRRADGDGAGSRRDRPRISLRLADFFGSQGFIVRPLQEAPELDYPIHGDVPNVPPGLRNHLWTLPLHDNHHGERTCTSLRGYTPESFAENVT